MEQIAYRRFLAHFENREKTYFVTFCTLNRRILDLNARSIILKMIVERHRIFFYLHTAVIMPDHVHLLLSPIDIRLSEVMKRIKGASAREVNRLRGGSGSLWQREYFDRQMRSTENIRQKGEYIANNPVSAGLVSSVEEYRWLWRAWVEGREDWL